MTTPRVQKLSSGCTRAQRCLGITSSSDGKMVFEAQGDSVVVRSTKTGEVVNHLRADASPKNANASAIPEKLRMRIRNQHIRAHFETQYKNPHPDDDAATVAAHKASWVQRQVDKFAIPSDFHTHVTAIALHPTQNGQLLVATADNLLRVWDVAQGVSLETFTLEAPVVWMQASQVDPSLLVMVLNDTARVERNLAVLMTKEKSNKKKTDNGVKTKASKKLKWVLNLHGLETTHWKLLSFNLTKGTVEDQLLARKYLPFYGAQMQQRSLQSSHINAVALIASSTLFYVRIGVKNTGDSAPRPVDTIRLEHVRQFSCVSIHPTYDEVVTGDSMGQMQVWRQLDNGGGVQPSKLHWHAHRVACVAYSRDGTYVASGGEEFVLVLWHLESGRRQYMPRLSAALSSIETKADGSGYLVACQDNSILLFNPVTNSHEWQKGGLGRVGLSASKTLIARGLPVEPWSNSLTVQSKSLVGAIQFYNPLQDRVVGSLALTQRNQVSRTDDEAPIRTYASHVCFTARTMATVTTTLDECVLRFWTRKSDGSFAIHTDVDMPHGDHTITATAAHGGTVVTADDHGEFRLWNESKTNSAWTCRSVAHFRERPIGAIAFSEDGSLLAVAYDSLLTLWDPTTNVLKSVLSYPKTAILDVLFAPRTPHVVVRTTSGVYVWSLLTCTVSWFYTLPVACIAIAPTTGHLVMCVVTKPKTVDVVTHVIVFQDMATPLPISIERLPHIDAAAVTYYKNRVVVMDAMSHVYSVGDAADAEAEASRTLAPDTTSILQQMYGSLKTQAKDKSADWANADQDTSVQKSLFEAPAHVLPPLRSLYRSFLDTMLKARDDSTSRPAPSSSQATFTTTSSTDGVQPPTKKAKLERIEKPEDTYAALKKVFTKKQ
ncbi:hypothetical protein LEN26_007170 [Aphanomyces euteiches]|nr:hypothetical protein LEN26_007170 [Aphanomyces euteiches]